MTSSEFYSDNTEGEYSNKENTQMGGGIGSFLKSIFCDNKNLSKDITIQLGMGKVDVALYLMNDNMPDLRYCDKYKRNALHYLVYYATNNRNIYEALDKLLNSLDKALYNLPLFLPVNSSSLSSFFNLFKS